MKPSSALKRSPHAVRTRSTVSKSTSLAMNAWGEVALDRTMCSAVRRRMLENGTTWSPAVRNGAIETVGVAGATRAGGAAGAAWTGAACVGTAGGGCAGGAGRAAGVGGTSSASSRG